MTDKNLEAYLKARDFLAEREAVLIANLHARKQEILDLKRDVEGHWTYQDLVYRFYHGSFKVLRLQDTTKTIVKFLQELCPEAAMNSFFLEIYLAGTTLKWDNSINSEWTKRTRPIVEAFLHAKYFLDMAAAHADIEQCNVLPSGWAGLLSFYNLR